MPDQKANYDAEISVYWPDAKAKFSALPMAYPNPSRLNLRPLHNVGMAMEHHKSVLSRAPVDLKTKLHTVRQYTKMFEDKTMLSLSGHTLIEYTFQQTVTHKMTKRSVKLQPIVLNACINANSGRLELQPLGSFVPEDFHRVISGVTPNKGIVHPPWFETYFRTMKYIADTGQKNLENYLKSIFDNEKEKMDNKCSDLPRFLWPRKPSGPPLAWSPLWRRLAIAAAILLGPTPTDVHTMTDRGFEIAMMANAPLDARMHASLALPDATAIQIQNAATEWYKYGVPPPEQTEPAVWQQNLLGPFSSATLPERTKNQQNKSGLRG